MSDLTALDSLLSKLPSGWSSPSITSVARLINGRGFKPHEWESDGLPIIRIQNLNGSTDFNYYSGSYNPKIEVNTGDLLFAWSGSRGTSFGPHFWNGPKGVLNYHTWRVKVDESAISPDFFYHALRFLTRIIEDRAHGASALVHVQKWEMEKFGFPCPNDPHEQQAIAAALSDADGVVAGLERVIAKKRLIKHGAMQDLLTARRRLPGFSGEWAKVQLKDYTSHGSGNSGLIKGTLQRSGRVGDYPAFTASGPDLMLDFFEQEGDAIIISAVGSRCGKSFRAKGKWSAIANTHVLRCREGLDADFAFIFMNDEDFWLKGGTGQPFVLVRRTLERPLLLPPVNEQQPIASVLRDMDAEIQTLESRLSKARAVKEGMMQNLLTGRVRLV